MGDRRKQALSVALDGNLKPRFHAAKITSDAGLLAFREPDEALRLTLKGRAVLSDAEEGSEAGLARWSSHSGMNRGKRGRFA